MKMIHAALAASVVMAFSTAALADAPSKATQMTEAQMAKIVGAGAGNGAEVIKPEQGVTFVFNSGRAERYNDSNGRGLTTVNYYLCQSCL